MSALLSTGGTYDKRKLYPKCIYTKHDIPGTSYTYQMHKIEGWVLYNIFAKWTQYAQNMECYCSYNGEKTIGVKAMT